LVRQAVPGGARPIGKGGKPPCPGRTVGLSVYAGPGEKRRKFPKCHFVPIPWPWWAGILDSKLLPVNQRRESAPTSRRRREPEFSAGGLSRPFYAQAALLILGPFVTQGSRGPESRASFCRPRGNRKQGAAPWPRGKAQGPARRLQSPGQKHL